MPTRAARNVRKKIALSSAARRKTSGLAMQNRAHSLKSVAETLSAEGSVLFRLAPYISVLALTIQDVPHSLQG